VGRVSSLQTQLPHVLRLTEELGGGMVGRAALGICWISLPPEAGAEGVQRLRRELAPSPCVLLDAPDGVRTAVDPWGLEPDGALELMRSVKQRFDPAGVLAPGLLVGGL
jgi:glycolate oxidase FAD binding subunit